ncbi:hypothetical protein AVEN_52-1 [Araneus ventricosus]|uniref:Uncharacterized protein n=1 Tax=Araneus ventricosus TaxID=182803 RepID=A0A4Y2HCI6_ARAVE|nr:hypothetical protein AVEN_52-1 [Araneus ventricosus]
MKFGLWSCHQNCRSVSNFCSDGSTEKDPKCGLDSLFYATNVKLCSHSPWFDVSLSEFVLPFAVGPQGIVFREFLGWLERSGERPANARASKEACRRTETSVQFLRAVDSVCVVRMVRLVGIQPAISPQ